MQLTSKPFKPMVVAFDSSDQLAKAPSIQMAVSLNQAVVWILQALAPMVAHVPTMPNQLPKTTSQHTNAITINQLLNIVVDQPTATFAWEPLQMLLLSLVNIMSQLTRTNHLEKPK